MEIVQPEAGAPVRLERAAPCKGAEPATVSQRRANWYRGPCVDEAHHRAASHQGRDSGRGWRASHLARQRGGEGALALNRQRQRQRSACAVGAPRLTSVSVTAAQHTPRTSRAPLSAARSRYGVGVGGDAQQHCQPGQVQAQRGRRIAHGCEPPCTRAPLLRHHGHVMKHVRERCRCLTLCTHLPHCSTRPQRALQALRM